MADPDNELDLLFSQLADGELTSDQVNILMLATLENPTARSKLAEMLRLRQAMAPARHRQRAGRQEPPARGPDSPNPPIPPAFPKESPN